MGIQLFLILLGILACDFNNKKPVLFEKGYFVAVVLETPLEKPNSYKSVLQIETIFQHDSVLPANELVIAYFAKNESISFLQAGDIIIFDKAPQSIENNNNPYEFDYKSYLEKKKVYRQVYLPSNNWNKTNRSKKSPFIWAERTREKLLQIYRNHAIDEKEFEILSALTLGYKRELDPETKRVFSASGAAHVLAVSGLHVGIIFWIITILFGFLRKRKSGRIIFMLITISILWIYAFIAGLSPSVMRAATMFSIIAVGEKLNRRSNIYNLLAASAFVLLLFNPNNLFDIGFQLSYAAVFGIVFLQPKLAKLIFVKNKILNFFWMLVTVSISAQIATFPISSFYFGQFPTYFWLTNTFVIPSVMVLIPLGMLMLVVSAIPVVSSALAFLLNMTIKLIYFLLSSIYKLPYSVLDISVGNLQLCLLLATIGAVFIFLKNQNVFYLKTALFFALTFMLSNLVKNINQLFKIELIVYNTGKNPSVHFIHGRNNYIISEEKITNDEIWFHPGIATKRKLGLKPPLFLLTGDTVINENLLLKNRLVFFEGVSLSINRKLTDLNKNKLPDFIVNPPYGDIRNIDIKQSSLIITNNSFNKDNSAISDKMYSTAIKGAFRKKW